MAASLLSPRVMSVCSTMVGIDAKKLVLLSIVAVRWSLS